MLCVRAPSCERATGRRYAEIVANANGNRGGRPPGPRMPCGWGCGAQLTCTEMRLSCQSAGWRLRVKMHSEHSELSANPRMKMRACRRLLSSLREIKS